MLDVNQAERGMARWIALWAWITDVAEPENFRFY
jgi:hypothetical protein